MFILIIVTTLLSRNSFNEILNFNKEYFQQNHSINSTVVALCYSLLATTIALLVHRGNTGGSGIRAATEWRCDPGGCGKPTIPAGIALRTLTAANDKTRKQFIG